MSVVCLIVQMFTDGRHPDAPVEEWVFAAWTADASLGVISGHRIVGRTAWYWAALARAGRPLLHVADFDVPVRSDPFIVKGEALWAEHFRDAPMEQWSVGNETYASAIDEPADALGRAYGTPTPIAFDLEWYAVSAPTALPPLDPDAPVDTTAPVDSVAPPVDTVAPAGRVDGYQQVGVVHGAIEIHGEARLELTEVAAHRWHRWAYAGTVGESAASAGAVPRLGPLPLRTTVAHTGVRAPFAFPDGTVSDFVLTSRGWAVRRNRAAD